MYILSLGVSQDCCLGMALRLTMATSQFLSIAYCLLAVVVVLAGASALGLNATQPFAKIWSPWQRH